MSVSVTMPQLGESVTEGTVTRWLKQVGDMVQADEPLLEVSTDKVDTEIPSPATGILLAIRAGEDETIAVGAELAVIGEASEAPGSGAPAAPAPVAAVPAPAPAAVPVAAPVAAMPAPVATAPAPVEAAPVAAAPAAAPVAAPASGTLVAVTLPALGESVTEGTVTRWLKQVGDTVQADEPILEISTDKVDTEIPSPASGTLVSIDVAEDSTVAVGTVLAQIATGAAAPVAAAPVPAPAPVVAAPAPVPVAPVQAPAPVVAAPTPVAVAPVQAPAPAPVAAPAAVDNADAYVTPLVRRLAAQQGIDLSTVVGTGVGGRVRKQDVAAAAEARSAASAPAASQTAPAVATTAIPVSPLRGRTEKLPRLRRVIAERMVESLQISAQLTTVIEVDVTRIAMLRSKVKADFEAREGVKLTFLPFFCKAAVEALKQFPQVNASINMSENTVTYHDSENLGIAVETERGLLAPVIRDAGELNISGLARRIADVAERTRTNKVSPDELSGGTFTVTNTGSRGALFDTPIINQPQVAILGTGAVVKRPIVVSDTTGQDVIAIRSMVYLALSYDHRLVDGADAAKFLSTMKARLEEAAFQSDLGL